MSNSKLWLPFAASLCGLLLLLGALGAAVHAQTAPKGDAWTDAPCTDFKLELPADSNVSCGYVTAPLRHAEPDGPTIQLAVVVLPSTAADRQPDPLFMAQGGPGGSTINTYAQVLIQNEQYRPVLNRDIVFWDQRGTLFSKPVLLCPEVSQADRDSALGVSDTQPEEDGLAPYLACGERLAAEAGDLSAFNSAENADDVEDVRAALGYDEINFYGVSYGTELGQFVMRQQPDHLRSVILDAVVPLDYNLLTEPAFAKERIAEKYFNECANDARCNAAFPNLAQRYLALIDRLNENPVTVTVAPMLSFTETHEIQLSGSLLESMLYGSLYSDVHDVIPLIIDQADKGNYSYVSTALLPSILEEETMATGMHMTVMCAERGDTDPSTADYSNINERLAEIERADAEMELAICRSWGIELLPRTDLDPVVSDIPTLLFSGDYDPITPPQYAEKLLPTLANVQHVIFPSGEHGQAVTSPCSNSIISSFLDNPTGELDASCAATPPAGFLTPADVIALPHLRQALAARGFAGLLLFAGEIAPGLLVGLFLLSVIPIYGIGWLIGRLMHHHRAEAPGWTNSWSRVAPWLALAAALVLLAFIGLLVFTVGATLMANQNLLLLGAIPSSWRWIFILPLLFALLSVLMVVTTVALWWGNHRSLIGRLYYTLLTLASLAAVWGLWRLDVMRI
ncbi:MAG: alpha/beta fold hydrolase [Caldilineaceae bacterium]|nr:alpha/beta fold hydrolase [Caldilineaceae bacterium]